MCLTTSLGDYITQTFKLGLDIRDAVLKEMREAFAKQPKMSMKDQGALLQKLTSLSEGEKRGLEPVSKDVNALVGNYVDGITRAMANDSLLKSLRTTMVEPGSKNALVMPSSKAPYSYVSMGHSQLAPYKVHPSIAPSLEFLYNTHGGGNTVLGCGIFEYGNKEVASITIPVPCKVPPRCLPWCRRVWASLEELRRCGAVFYWEEQRT